MSLKKAIPLSLAASDNEYIASLSKPIAQDVRQGESLTEAFRIHSVFPPEMIDVLSNAEESGQVPEAMLHYSKELADRAEHQLQLLNQALGWLVWLVVAGIIVFFILRIALVAYVRPIYDTLDSMPGGRG
jgi:protein transport protein HofC